MKITIDEEQCKKFDLPVGELLYIVSAYLEDPITSDVFKKAINDGFIVANEVDKNNIPIKITITSDGINKIESILLDSEFNPSTSGKRFDELAVEMQELFPKGRKEGTNLMWRDSKNIISKRLKALTKKYNVTFTNEQALNATKRYIDSFNGDYRFMQVLKYFISKKNINTGEENSQLLSYIENEGDEILDNNWNTDLV